MFRKNLTIFMLVGILTTLTVTSTYLMNASAYKPEDPAAKYHCFASDANGNYNLTAEGDLIPCEIDSGDNAWMLTASALVLIMTPGGLAIFYGGLSRQKNAVNTLHMVFMTTGIIAVQWALWGYSLAFGPDAGGYGFIGTLDWVGLNDVLHDVPSIAYGGITGTTIPHQTYMVFQMMFAIITPALIVASLAERMKYSAFIIFIILWATFVYDFAAHWTWSISGPDNYGLNPGYPGFGWTGNLGSLDFAGGTVIHITSGWAGLVIALMLGRRIGYGKVPMEP
ncbi:MAG: ammonium transporter, partial [Nitrososphaeraceae archaeon]